MAEANYDVQLFGRLAEVEPRSFWFRARNRLITSVLSRYFSQMTSLLEVGCGTGFVLSGIRDAYPQARLVGIDVFEEGLSAARRRVPDAELYRLEAGDLAFDREFDVVCAFDVLEHLDDDQSALAQMRRAVKPSGGLVLLVPQHSWLWSDADAFAHHRRRYRRRDIVQQITAAGFEVEFVSSFMTTLLPAMVVSRLAQRALRRPYNLWRELEPAAFNRPFEHLLDLEAQLLVQRRISLPAGGSLLLVARTS